MQFTTRPVVMGTRGVVAAGHYLAAVMGLDVLSRGGNAVDAGVAATFALTLLKPHECGIGGECPILIYRRTPGSLPNPLVISGQGPAPRRASVELFRSLGLIAIPGRGLLSATVPATFGALLSALIHGGRLGLAETLGPVADQAREGFPLYPAMRTVLARHEERCRLEYPATTEIYYDARGVPAVGTRVRPRAWSQTMQTLLDVETKHRRRGRVAALEACVDAFYRGPIATEIAGFVASTMTADEEGRSFDGLLDGQDMADFRTRLEPPASLAFRGVEVFKCGPWSQGPVFLQQLALLDPFDLAAIGHNTPAYIHTVTEVAKLAFADRERLYGDPDFVDVPLQRLLSPEYNDKRRKLIDPDRARNFSESADSEAAAIGAEFGASDNGDTTHVDVIDAEGNMFSATPSGGWIQSSPVIPALGFPLGTRAQQFNLRSGHPNALAPGKRPRTTLSPSLALRNGQPHMVFGTEGGDNQDQWTLQFFLNAVVFGMDLQAAVDAPLFHSTAFPSSFFPHEATTRGLVLEGRIPESTREALAALDHQIEVADDWSSGQVTGVRFTPDSGLIEGAASPRSMAAYAVAL